VLLLLVPLVGFAGEEKEDQDDYEKEYTPGFGPGGGPFLAVRFFLEIDELNGYLDDIGSFSGERQFGSFLFPFVNGGGGTWRFSISEKFQVGFVGYGYGLSTYGYLHHTEDTEGADNTIDENDDDLDDYISYVDYGFGAWNFLMQYKIELIPTSLYLEIGGVAGLGIEGITVSRNQRTVLDALPVQILTGNSDWERTFLNVGGFLGVQIPFKGTAGIVSLGIESGFNYHINFIEDGKWTPGVGIHRTEKSPPKDFNSMNIWFNVGPQFNY
jgi:hypothetical protein